MSGSFESVPCVHRLNLRVLENEVKIHVNSKGKKSVQCVHRLNLRVLENGVKIHVNSKGKKSPPPEDHRRVEPETLHHTGQRTQHTTD